MAILVGAGTVLAAIAIPVAVCAVARGSTLKALSINVVIFAVGAVFHIPAFVGGGIIGIVDTIRVLSQFDNNRTRKNNTRKNTTQTRDDAQPRTSLQ